MKKEYTHKIIQNVFSLHQCILGIVKQYLTKKQASNRGDNKSQRLHTISPFFQRLLKISLLRTNLCYQLLLNIASATSRIDCATYPSLDSLYPCFALLAICEKKVWAHNFFAFFPFASRMWRRQLESLYSKPVALTKKKEDPVIHKLVRLARALTNMQLKLWRNL